MDMLSTQSTKVFHVIFMFILLVLTHKYKNKVVELTFVPPGPVFCFKITLEAK